jgi:hypothetical protein
VPSSISLVSGSPYGNVFETRSNKVQDIPQSALTVRPGAAAFTQKSASVNKTTRRLFVRFAGQKPTQFVFGKSGTA